MKKIHLVLLLITISTIVISFLLSEQTAEESLKLSDHLLVRLNIVSVKEVILETVKYRGYSTIFREVAHVALYSIIALPLFLLIYSWIRKLYYTLPLTFVILMMYAVLDEYHQIRVVGRAFEKFDLLMDLIGCGITIIVATVSIWVSQKIKKSTDTYV